LSQNLIETLGVEFRSNQANTAQSRFALIQKVRELDTQFLHVGFGNGANADGLRVGHFVFRKFDWRKNGIDELAAQLIHTRDGRC
jgi:hypothetical protein